MRRSVILPLVAGLSLLVGTVTLVGDETVDHQAILTPRIDGEYVTVYRPAGDRFPGPGTPELTAGRFYEEWVPNDHAIVKGPDGRWHALGITHPLTSTRNVHEGEFQSFHAVAPPGAFRDVCRDGLWRDRPKVLPPAERPGEILENHAPFIVPVKDQFVMLYGPSPMRLATSTDLHQWVPQGTVFEEQAGARDPNVLFWQGRYYIVYCSEDRVEARTSDDLKNWSGASTILRMPENVAPESPTLLHLRGVFYLFVCGWNGVWDRQTVAGAYQHVTYVFASDNPLQFEADQEVTRVDAHAPEVFQDEEGSWYISSAEWPRRGVSVARLRWE